MAVDIRHNDAFKHVVATYNILIGIRARMRGRVYLSGLAVQLQQIAARAVRVSEN